MDNIKRKIIKELMKSCVELKDQVLQGKYCEEELAAVYEHWLKAVVDNLSTIRSDYSQEVNRRGSILTVEESDDTEVRMYARAIVCVLDNLEAMLNGRYTLEPKFTFQLPKGVLKDDLELVYDGFKLYDSELPEDKIDMREGILRDIIVACFPEPGIENRKLLERNLDKCKGKAFYRRFNTLQHNWASTFHCSMELMQTIIYRDKGCIFVGEKVKAKWSL